MKTLSPHGDRLTINMCPFLPSDPRNKVVGRVAKSYDAVIVFKKSLLARTSIRLNHNGIVSSDDAIGW
eukprot:1060975-Heterocapsa_arctica.AAC.1